MPKAARQTVNYRGFTDVNLVGAVVGYDTDGVSLVLVICYSSRCTGNAQGQFVCACKKQ